MTKRSWVVTDFAEGAGLCVRAGVWTALAAGLVLSALPVVAAARPTHPARKAHAETKVAVGVARGPKVRRTQRVRAAQTEQTPSKPQSRGAQPKGKTHPPKPQAKAKSKPKTRRHKLRPEDEADNDPVLIHRAKMRQAQSMRGTPGPRQLATLRSVSRPERRELYSSESHAAETHASGANTPGPKPLTPADFMRAAGASPVELAAKPPLPPPPAETFERGESHPDDDERLPTRAAILATATRDPSSPSQERGPPLPETLHRLAAQAQTAVKTEATDAKEIARAAKLTIARHVAPEGRTEKFVMPDDPAERAAVVAGAMTPTVMPVLYARGRLIVPPPMKGNHDILVHQNAMADNEGLDRIQDNEDLDRMRAAHLLVPLRGSASLLVNPALPVNRRYARTWTAKFAADTAQAFYAQFHRPLRLNSAVRTVEYQLRLQRVNGNAAAVDGDGASPHLTGQALDFGKRGMTLPQIAWMRAYLQPLMQAGKLDVEEEFQQACFHVSVYRSYLPAVAKKAAKVEVAQVGPEAPTHVAIPARAAMKANDALQEK